MAIKKSLNEKAVFCRNRIHPSNAINGEMTVHRYNTVLIIPQPFNTNTLSSQYQICYVLYLFEIKNSSESKGSFDRIKVKCIIAPSRGHSICHLTILIKVRIECSNGANSCSNCSVFTDVKGIKLGREFWRVIIDIQKIYSHQTV